MQILDLHGYSNQLVIGLILTIKLAVCSLVVGTVFGAGGAALQLSNSRIGRSLGYSYAAIVRGIPDLLIIFLIYFGGTITLNAIFGRYIEVNPFIAGVLALGFSFGAFVSEVFRGAVVSIPRGQHEAASALGLSKPVELMTVVLPQAIRIALPSYGNSSIVLLKQTSLVSIIGCDELMRKSAEAAGATREPFTIYIVTAMIYLLLTGVSTVALEYAERRSSRYLER